MGGPFVGRLEIRLTRAGTQTTIGGIPWYDRASP